MVLFMFFFRFIVLSCIGMANALPLPLSGSVLSIWLSELGFEKAAIGFYALFGLPFSFKLVWSPIVDQIDLPFLKGSPRKGWMIVALLSMSLSLFAMSSLDPSQDPWRLGFWLFFLSLFTGCLYVVGVCYELESLEESSYQIGSSFVVAGYRIGLLLAGGGGLYLTLLCGWSFMYFFMGSLLLAFACLIFFLPEPYKSKEVILLRRELFKSHPTLFQGFWKETLLKPLENFFERPDIYLILLLIIGFKSGSHLSKTMEGPFYLSLGFNKGDLAMAAKIWGFFFTIFGAFFSGFFIKDKNPFYLVPLTGCLHSFSLLFHAVLAFFGKSYPFFYIAVALENLTGGIAMSAFIYFLWRVCDKRYASVQYALVWSFFSFKGDILACFGGLLATSCSWSVFFLIAAFIGLGSSIFVISLSHKMLGLYSKSFTG